MRLPVPLLLLAALACRAAPPAAPPAPFALAATQRVDARALEAAAPAFEGRAWLVELECAWIERLGPDAGTPLNSAARHVFARGDAAALQPRGELALGGRWLADEPRPAPRAWQTSERHVLPAGATLVAALEPAVGLEDPARPAWRRLALELSRADAAAELTLVLQGGDGDELERLLLDARPFPGGTPARLWLPAPRQAAPQGGVLVTLAVESFPRAPSPQLAADLERAERELGRARERARAEQGPLSPAEGARLERAGALRALGDPDRRRAALFLLADACGARLAADVALLGDDTLLAACADALAQRLGPEDDLDAARLAWSLEAAATRALLALAAAQADALEDQDAEPLPAEFEAVLLARAGELARYPDLLGEVVAASADLPAYEARLERENLFFLEDSDPAARVRAHDWLATRGAAPAGYDPLGARDARRAALDAARQEAP